MTIIHLTDQPTDEKSEDKLDIHLPRSSQRKKIRAIQSQQGESESIHFHCPATGLHRENQRLSYKTSSKRAMRLKSCDVAKLMRFSLRMMNHLDE